MAKTKELTLLYVEDDDILRESTLALLNNFFDDIETAVDGQDGLEKFQKHPFDLIMSDIRMPKLDGLSMSREIRTLNPQQHIIILSAHNDTQYFESSIDIGIDGYLVKPLKTEQFLHVLNKACTLIYQQIENTRYKTHLEREVAKQTQDLEEILIKDRTTKLPNRVALEKYFKRENSDINVILFNIDNFSSVNMSFGYETGDQVLQKVSDFLLQILPPKTTLYHIGSDEFLLLTTLYDIPYLQNVAKNILNTFIDTPIQLEKDISIRLTLTAAIAQGDRSNIVQHAELGLVEARKIGKNHIYIYTKDDNFYTYQKERLEWIHRVKNALEKNLVTPFFQPIINNKTKKVDKYECLARILEDGKIITPNFFIEPARLSGQIIEITKQMIEKSFKMFKDNTFEFSINIESEDLNANYLTAFIKEHAKKNNIAYNRIVIEVLEHISTYDQSTTISQLQELKEMGLKIAIDDFGSEQSNFSRVLDIHADYIKIDAQFIKSIHKDPKSYKIAAAITHLAKNLDAKIIAEFVHNEDIFKKILELDIDYSQGYYFGQPSASLNQ